MVMSRLRSQLISASDLGLAARLLLTELDAGSVELVEPTALAEGRALASIFLARQRAAEQHREHGITNVWRGFEHLVPQLNRMPNQEIRIISLAGANREFEVFQVASADGPVVGVLYRESSESPTEGS